MTSYTCCQGESGCLGCSVSKVSRIALNILFHLNTSVRVSFKTSVHSILIQIWTTIRQSMFSSAVLAK